MTDLKERPVFCSQCIHLKYYGEEPTCNKEWTTVLERDAIGEKEVPVYGDDPYLKNKDNQCVDYAEIPIMTAFLRNGGSIFAELILVAMLVAAVRLLLD